MAPESGGKSREAKLEPSEIICNPLENKDNTQAIRALLNVIQSSTGPSGKQKLIHNGKGGHITCTSTSGRILQNLSVSNHLLQLLLAPVQNHIKFYYDGGLTSLLLALFLVDASCKLDIHKHLLIDIYEILLDRSVAYLVSESCRSKVSITFDNTENLLQIVNGVLGSKSGSCLTANNKLYICKLVVEGFLKTFSEKSPVCDCLVFVGIEGRCVSESKLFEGVLFETPQIPVYKKTPLVVKKYRLNKGQQDIKVALFTVSLSGDFSSLHGARYEVTKVGQVEDAILKNLMCLGERITADGIRLVLCQKVVHPKLKKYWKKEGILVLDRLGITHKDLLIRLSGCMAISSLDAASVCPGSYGWLSSVEHVVIEGKSYIHLTAEGSSLHTLIICNFTEEPLQELMHACKSARELLRITLQRPEALLGCGCWQAELALHLKSQVVTESILTDLGCSTQQWTEGSSLFCRCLARLSAVVDNGSGSLHLWMKETSILDEFENVFPVEHLQTLPEETVTGVKPVLDQISVVLNLLKTAITAANMLLSVGVIIKDPN